MKNFLCLGLPIRKKSLFASMESSRGHEIIPKMSANKFIRTINECLNKYHKSTRSRFGYFYPITSSRGVRVIENIEEYTHSRFFTYIALDFVKANHWHQVVQFLLYSLDYYLPPVFVIQKLLDIMLVIDAESFVIEAKLYLYQLSMFYPPKTSCMTRYYWEIFKEEKVQQRRMPSLKNPCASFLNILHALEAELNNLDQKNNNSSSIAINVSCVDLEQHANKENEFEEEDTDDSVQQTLIRELLQLCDETFLSGKHMKLWWANASCEQRINRLLYVISVMIEIFQVDIDVWKKRSPEAQKHPLACPIMSVLIWEYNDWLPSSMIVKMIVNMYAICLRNKIYNCLTQIERLVSCIAVTLPSSPLDRGDGYPPDSHQRRVFAQHIAVALLECGISDNMIEIALARLNPDWFRLIVTSKIHSQRSRQSCGDLPLNVAQLAQLIVQGLSWGDNADCAYGSSSCSDEDEPATTTRARGRKKRGVKRNAKGETQLHVLARTGKSEKLSELLVNQGCLINVADYAGWTPVHEAVSHGHLDCVKILCQYNKSKVGKHQMKLRTISGKSERGESSEMHRTSLAVNLHAKGGDMGLTPLHEAVIQNQVQIADLLLKYGGPSLLNDMTNAGLTPLDLARNNRMLNVLKRRKEEGRIVEKKWLSEMKTNAMHLPCVPSDRSCVSLRCMLLNCYLEANCLFDIMENLKKNTEKCNTTKSSAVKNIDYLEKSHDLKALRYLQGCLKSRLCGKITLPEAYLLVFLC